MQPFECYRIKLRHWSWCGIWIEKAACNVALDIMPLFSSLLLLVSTIILSPQMFSD